jgi:hypothetical protein
METAGTWEIQFASERDIFANNLKKRGCGDGKLEVGLTHSRGVVGVMFCEFVFKTDTRRG